MRVVLDSSVIVTAAAGCDFLVTGDDDLLSVGEHEGVKIVTPRLFWGSVRKGKRG